MDQKTAILIPSHEKCNSTFAACLAELTRRAGSSCWVLLASGTYVHTARELLADRVLDEYDGETTHVLWLDSDMMFPADTLARLQSGWNQDRVVCANYRRRIPPYNFCAARVSVSGTPEEVATHENSSGLEEVSFAGMGICYMSVGQLRSVDKIRFRFAYGDPSDHTTMVGEDVRFLQELGDDGISTVIDHDLSKQVNHNGIPTLPLKQR